MTLAKSVLIAAIVIMLLSSCEDSSTPDFSLEEIETMARMKVKIAFEGELTPHVVTPNMTNDQLAKIESIDLSNLGLHELPSWLAQFTKLRSLNLADNNLASYKLGVLSDMKVLEVLNLNRNYKLGDYQPVLDRSDIRRLSNLRVLSLSGIVDNDTKCDSIPKCIGNFDSFKSLKKVNLSNNKILYINQISGLGQYLRDYGHEDRDLSNMEKYDLADEGITFRVPSTLEELNLSHNRIKDIPFFKAPSLQKFSLQRQIDKDGRSIVLKLDPVFGDAFTMQQLRVMDIDANAVIPDSLRRKLKSWKNN